MAQTIQVTYTEQVEQEVKKAYQVLYVWYDGNRQQVLQDMNNNPLAVDNAALWESEINMSTIITPEWNGNGVDYHVDEIVLYNGVQYKVLQDHTSQSNWNPVDASSLWGIYRPLGKVYVWVQPLGSTDAWQLGAQVSHVGKIWESMVDNNTWEPGQVGDNIWKEITT